jgi:hypothetical protein
MADTHASKEALQLQRLCSSIGLVQQAVRLDSDSHSAIFLAKNYVYHSKTKHIVTREKLSMAKGKPQQTGMTAEINSIPTYAI